MFVDEMEMPLEQLEHRITSMAGQIAATTCEWLQLVAEFDRREGWALWGVRSCAHWLSLQCGMALRTGRDHIRTAHALASLPLTTAAFARGELSYSKVRAVTRIATPASEAELVEFARTATASQLDASVRAYERTKQPFDKEQQERRLQLESLGNLRGHLTAEEIALLRAALDEAMKHLPVDDGSAEPRSIDQRRADALVLLAESFLANGPASRRGNEQTMVVLHVDADQASAPELDNGVPLHPDTAKRLCCDASVVSIIERDGVPIGIGRKSHTVPRRLRRLTLARDRRCKWPGCTNQLFLQVHHRWHWTDGGPTDLDNLVALCSFHHHVLHRGGFRIDDDHRVYRPDGTEVVAKSGSAEPLEVTKEHDTINDLVSGERLDLDETVVALHSLLGTLWLPYRAARQPDARSSDN